jgi:hypothetical protein
MGFERLLFAMAGDDPDLIDTIIEDLTEPGIIKAE